MKLLIPIFALIFISNAETKFNYADISSQPDTLIVFSEFIKLKGHHSEEFNGYSFNPVTVYYKDNIVFKDSLNEYWLNGAEAKDYPKLLNCLNGSYQLLIVVDERPNNNKLLCITIYSNGTIKKSKLPLFNWKLKDIDNDKKFEFQGNLSFGETIATGDTAFYNPILVYELSDNCLILDTLTTIRKNEKVWGKFHGFYYNDTLLLPYDSNEW